MIFFENVKSIDELKKVYRALCKIHHPDLGGSVETMQKLNEEYDSLLSRYMINEGMSFTEQQDAKVLDRALINAYLKIISLDGLLVEACGLWLWVSGDTRRHKDTLKQAGFLWSPKKLMWYWRAEDQKRKRFKSSSMDEIRSKYGSKVFNRYSVV